MLDPYPTGRRVDSLHGGQAAWPGCKPGQVSVVMTTNSTSHVVHAVSPSNLLKGQR